MVSILLLLLCFVSYCGTTAIPVPGQTGENAVLPCDFEAGEISHIVLSGQSKIIAVCENEECNGRVFKEGSCGVVIKHLMFSDAGKYFLRVYYTNDQTELERIILEYQLHIQDEISVKKGAELKLDVLLTNADKVEHQSNTEWTEVWARGHGVSGDRLTDSDGTLTINAFTSTDTGTYRVLDYRGEMLITVTLTESGSTGEHKARRRPDRDLVRWPETLRAVFVITVFLCYIVLMAVQIVMRVFGLW